jgi:O-antigen ligase
VIAYRKRRHQEDKRWRQILRIALLVGLVLLILVTVVFVVAQRNNYFSRLWTYWTDEESEGTYLYYIAFDQRFVYWETAYKIFGDHPVLGIGLGNLTFYFPEYLPDRQYRNSELLLKLVPEEGRNQIVTVKNFFLRILTETGVLGFSTFLTFLIALTGCVFFLFYSPDQNANFWGMAGLLGMVALLPVTLSVDSFAIPNMWVVFGLITASTHIFKNKLKS